LSSAAAPTPAPGIRPFGLARADLLKLRKRRGLVITVGLMTVGLIVVVEVILVVLHAVNPAHHGPAGGLDNLTGGTGVINFLGSVAAIIAGSTAGTSDLRSGVFRELVVTGRSRLALFFARVPGGLGFVLPFMIVTYAIIAVLSGTLTDFAHPAPSTGTMIEVGVWALAVTAFYFVLGLSLGSLLGSQGPTIGILLAWRLFLMPILAHIGFLGGIRDALPNIAFASLVPHAARSLRETTDVHLSSVAAVLVLLLWTGVALAVGAWRTATRDV
jgi:hypothetical protein